MTVSIGIAGWSYADWKGVVYPRGCRDTLRYCARLVDCIEVNSTFYRPPDPRTTSRWVERTRDLPVFFTAKLPREFTHERRVESATVDDVRAGFAPLIEAGRLRVLLAQFSYGFTAAPRSRELLARLADAFGDLCPLTVEVRHRSWQSPSALDALRGLGVGVAHLDYPGATSGFGLRHTGVLGPDRIAYLRLHGRNRSAWFRRDAGRDEVYDWTYSGAEVEDISARIGEMSSGARDVVVIANNHFCGQAVKVALELLAHFRERPVEVPPDLLRAFPSLGC